MGAEREMKALEEWGDHFNCMFQLLEVKLGCPGSFQEGLSILGFVPFLCSIFLARQSA
jgi:hypothetical protein